MYAMPCICLVGRSNVGLVSAYSMFMAHTRLEKASRRDKDVSKGRAYEYW